MRGTGVAAQRYFWRGSPGCLAVLQGWGERGGTGEGKESRLLDVWVVGVRAHLGFFFISQRALMLRSCSGELLSGGSRNMVEKKCKGSAREVVITVFAVT